MDTDGCADFDCFEGVECEDVPAPGVGAECGPCPDGFYGDGAKCAGKWKHVKFDEVKFIIHVGLVQIKTEIYIDCALIGISI